MLKQDQLASLCYGHQTLNYGYLHCGQKNSFKQNTKIGHKNEISANYLFLTAFAFDGAERKCLSSFP